MIVYRYENRDGVGPYQSGSWGEAGGEYDIYSAHDDQRIWQTPHEAGIDYDYLEQGYVCGLTSLDDFMQWFDGWHELLERYGFRATVWNVPEEFLAQGRTTQVVFDRHNAKMVECLTPIPDGVV